MREQVLVTEYGTYSVLVVDSDSRIMIFCQILRERPVHNNSTSFVDAIAVASSKS